MLFGNNYLLISIGIMAGLPCDRSEHFSCLAARIAYNPDIINTLTGRLSNEYY